MRPALTKEEIESRLNSEIYQVTESLEYLGETKADHLTIVREYDVYNIYCRECGTFMTEHSEFIDIDFTEHQCNTCKMSEKGKITKELNRLRVELLIHERKQCNITSAIISLEEKINAV